MLLVTAQEMRLLDKISIRDFHIPSETLMENAGQGVAAAIQKWISKRSLKKASVAIFLGKGNNAGDGLVAARYLTQNGHAVSLIPLYSEGLSPDTQKQLKKLESFRLRKLSFPKDVEKILECDLFVDAIFGTGLDKEITGSTKELIQWMNESGKAIMAVDIPSGLSANTGRPHGIAIHAQTTVTFGWPKIGFYGESAKEYTGLVEVIDIGIPRESVRSLPSPTYLTERNDFLSLQKERLPGTHKGDYGHVLVIAGSNEMLGAGYLASVSALRAGCGIVTYALPASCFQKFESQYPEIIPAAIEDEGTKHFVPSSIKLLQKLCEGKDVVVLGPGLGRNPKTAELLLEFLPQITQPIVLDAEGLTGIASHPDILLQRKGLTILTPHPGEMAALLETAVAVIQENRIQTARDVSNLWKCVVVLKGHRTVTAFPTGEVYINPTGNPGMATAGMGDVLAGFLGGLMAQDFSVKESVIGGVYCHGLAGDTAREEKGEKGLVASDLFDFLPQTLGAS